MDCKSYDKASSLQNWKSGINGANHPFLLDVPGLETYTDIWSISVLPECPPVPVVYKYHTSISTTSPFLILRTMAGPKGIIKPINPKNSGVIH
ncbi:MAG: hypothetical protein AAF620_10795 [Bacteroidota bacterium]